MTQKIVFFKFLLLLFIVLISGALNAQNTTKKAIPLATVLDKISKKHKVFFTYDANLIANKAIQEIGFTSLDLKESISLLQKLTAFLFDDLGNNYYVIYSKKNSVKKKVAIKKEVQIIKNIALDSVLKTNKITVKGIILSSDNTPLNGATLQDSKSLVGTTTEKDGTFNFKIQKDNYITISYLGHNSTSIKLTENIFHTITLIAGQQLDEVKIVGSRNKNRVVKDSPLAIDVIDVAQNETKSIQLDVNQFLQYAIPSFNATKQSGADGADHIIPATIRGLGPDQTLVLINGKRRHQASLINLYGTRGRGNSGTDLNAIPISAIKRIELLRDGASAQYGSDAIAGVINIVLKDSDNTLAVNGTFGFNNANTNSVLPDQVDGFTYKLGLNYGTKIAKGGFINFTAEALSTENTLRPGNIYRQKFGQAGVKNVSAFFNSEVPVNTNAKLYANGGYNYKNTQAYAFTREANNERNVLAIYPNGFNPLITSNILDNSFSFGLITNFKNWTIDISNTLGRNNFHYFIKNTLNATLGENSPTEFDAGGHELIQNTTNIDFSKYFKSKSYGFNIAMGLEYRLDKYIIFEGEEASYATYSTLGNVVNSETPIQNYSTYNGIIRPGGSQGFPGYSPDNNVNRNRSNFSVYADTEIDFSKKFMIGTALRYENYSDFGSTLNGKLAARYKITPKFNLRSSFSTGFRAPSLAQIYYNLTFTNFIGNTPTESFLIANNSPLARSFNIDKLSEEKARNFSFGFTTQVSPNFKINIDTYYVSIKDRIILSGNFDATTVGYKVENIQFFANGVDTETLGLDIVLKWKKAFTNSALFLDLSGNINHMSIAKVNNKELNKETFFGKREQQFLLASAPRSKFNFGINYELKKLKATVNFTHFSAIELIDWQIHKDLSEFNNSEAERLKTATDVYEPKITTDIHFSYKINKLLTFQVGANNLFNIYPTEQQNYTDSGGLWDATQMGTNGSFYYTKLNLKL